MAYDKASVVSEELERDAKRRLQAARDEKQPSLTDFCEAFQFCFPQRVRPGNNSTTASSRTNSASQNFTSLGERVIVDFASAISDTFAPEHTPWAGEEITSAVPDEILEDAKDAVKKDTAAVFDAIGTSNFYESFKQGAKDLGVSAFGLIIEDPGRAQPIRNQVVPLPELLFLRDPNGGIGARFWEQTRDVQDIIEMFPDIDLPQKVYEKKGKKGKAATVKKTQGCWRDYSDKADIAWHYITMLDDEPIQYSREKGIGAASILVCRWDPDAPFAWGNGPAIKALPDFRALDEVVYLTLKGMARAVDPPVAYDDDSIINLDGGLPNGALIAKMHGSEIVVVESENPNSMSDASKLASDIEHDIRKGFYVDEPQQEGLTPPTLGQWMDESMRTQRRLGTPAACIWTEFLSEVFLRFRYLLSKRGDLAPITVNGKAVTLRAVNPLQRAAEMEEAAASLRFLQSVAAIFGPPIIPVICDVGDTIHRLQEQAKATGVKLLSAQAINQAITDQSKLNAISQGATAVGQSGVLPLLAANKQGVTPQ